MRRQGKLVRLDDIDELYESFSQSLYPKGGIRTWRGSLTIHLATEFVGDDTSVNRLTVYGGRILSRAPDRQRAEFGVRMLSHSATLKKQTWQQE